MAATATSSLPAPLTDQEIDRMRLARLRALHRLLGDDPVKSLAAFGPPSMAELRAGVRRGAELLASLDRLLGAVSERQALAVRNLLRAADRSALRPLAGSMELLWHLEEAMLAVLDGGEPTAAELARPNVAAYRPGEVR